MIMINYFEICIFQHRIFEYSGVRKKTHNMFLYFTFLLIFCHWNILNIIARMPSQNINGNKITQIIIYEHKYRLLNIIYNEKCTTNINLYVRRRFWTINSFYINFPFWLYSFGHGNILLMKFLTSSNS